MDDIRYEGKGKERPDSPNRQAIQKSLKPWEHPRDYIAGDELVDAVNAARFLQQPLLVTGQPGSGKTQLAYSIAWELDLPLQVFHTKMNASGDDLLYSYDALLHFHDANTRGENAPGIDVRKYVTYNALGAAIRLSRGPSEWDPKSVREDETWKPTMSVVLIDEIDKAPRDFPNDILHETDQLSFEVKQTRWKFAVNRDLAPIVIITSNQERSLPDAFLRRCVFFHIPFPDAEELKDIVRRRLSNAPAAEGTAPSVKASDTLVKTAVARFEEIRGDDQLIKQPATAELISWIRLLSWKGFTADDLGKKNDQRLASTLTALLKTREDLARYGPEPASGSGTLKATGSA